MMEVFPGNITPSIDDPEVQAFARQIKADGELVKVEMDPKPLPLGNCYWNAAYVRSQRGGRVRLGWLMTKWPGFFIAAMHHAVLEDMNGHLLDVTAKFPKDAATFSVFLPDESIPVVDLTKIPSIASKHKDLSKGPAVQAPAVQNFIRCYQAKYRADAELAEVYYELGYRAEVQQAHAAGLPHPQIQLDAPSDGGARARAAQAAVAKTKQDLGDAIMALRRLEAKR